MPRELTPVDAELFVRYLTGEVTEGERARVDGIVAGSDAHAVVARQLAVLPERDGESTVLPDVERALARFHAVREERAAMEREEGNVVDGLLRQRVFSRRTLRGGAAEFVQRKPKTAYRGARGWRLPTIGIVLSALIVVALKKSIEWRAAHHPDSVSDALRYTTRTGQYAHVTLVDGTRVTLAPQTTLRVTPDFGRATRVVSLIGEAYFDVRMAQEIPFIVRTTTISTRVLGTAFDVQRYLTDTAARIAVVTGKVLVTSGIGGSMRHRSIISSGMAIQVTDSFMVRTSDDAVQYATWVTGRLVFREIPIENVLTALSRWYGYQFRLADSTMSREKVTIGLSTESSAAALATLKNTLDVEFDVEGQVITLRRRQHVDGGLPTRREWHRTDHQPFTTEVGR